MRKVLGDKSIARKLAAFLAVMLTIQCALFTLFLLYGGTMDRLDKNAMSVFSERVAVRENYLESDMLHRWSNLDRTQAILGDVIGDFLADRQLTVRSLTPRNPETTQLLKTLSPDLISLLRGNSVTGVFVIFQGQSPRVASTRAGSAVKSGLYLRDMDPTSNPMDNSDIMIERGSADLFRALGLPMDVNWAPTFLVGPDFDPYLKPMEVALTKQWRQAEDLGYWCPSFLLDDGFPTITYSEPLLDERGFPYGVLGVEISVEYLQRLLPAAELAADKSGAYLLTTVQEEAGAYQAVALNGHAASQVLEADICQLESTPRFSSVYQASTDPEIYASVQPLALYSADSPFFETTWALIGLMPQERLFAISLSVAGGVLWLTLSTILVGLALAFLAGHFITRPIRVLADTVRRLDPSQPVSLPLVSIREIDELAIAIERMSRDVSDSASRLSRIIELANIPLAVFELGGQLDHPVYTKNLFPLLGLPTPPTALTSGAFQQVLDSLAPYLEEEDSGVSLYRLPRAEVGYAWLRLQTLTREGGVLGAVTDVTEEITEKRRLEYERDYDVLTNLLNRRSFQARISKLERRPRGLKTAAMLMLDLDNLKYLNDTYGHDCGDQYIRCAADVLRGFTVFGGLAARISGDEFYLLLSGYGDRAALNEVIRRLQVELAAASIRLPNGQSHRLRASTGIAWYPDDSASLFELMRFSDFAMYEAKTAVKGGSRNFNLNSYHRDAFLLYGHEELNRILDESAVDYIFQPIVSCRDGGVLGYEALMRPHSKALASPLDVLRIARAQSKLSQIERLTWFRSLECFTALDRQSPGGCLLFLNSVSSQVLEPAEMEAFLAAYGPYLNRLVVEFTEGDELDDEATTTKQELCRQHEIRLALDDFGTGYSNDSVLLRLGPDFVKADMSLIRGVDQDATRQTMLRNLIALCRDLKVKVIAEGVETREELQTVIALGADYIQGYYTGRPAFTLSTVDQAVVQEIKACHQGQPPATAGGTV